MPWLIPEIWGVLSTDSRTFLHITDAKKDEKTHLGLLTWAVVLQKVFDWLSLSPST